MSDVFDDRKGLKSVNAIYGMIKKLPHRLNNEVDFWECELKKKNREQLMKKTIKGDK